MPGTVVDDVELIIEDIRGNGGGKPPSRDGDDDGGGGGGHTPDPRRPNSKKYSTAVLLAIISITIFFLVPTAAFVALRSSHRHDWIGLHLPGVLWVNTFVLLASSATLELARRKLRFYDAQGFRRMWTLTTVL